MGTGISNDDYTNFDISSQSMAPTRIRCPVAMGIRNGMLRAVRTSVLLRLRPTKPSPESFHDRRSVEHRHGRTTVQVGKPHLPVARHRVRKSHKRMLHGTSAFIHPLHRSRPTHQRHRQQHAASTGNRGTASPHLSPFPPNL